MPTVNVRLGKRSYSVHVLAGGLSRLGTLVAAHYESRRAALITSPRVFRLHGKAAQRALQSAGYQLETIVVPDGERAKTPARVTDLHNRLASARLERSDPLVVLAGGTLGDLAGFAAATYLRGVPLVHVPTTLMAQVDSATGGKTGVNLSHGKNLVGAIWQPGLVLCDPRVLATLPPRQFRAGLAEVVKYGCIARPTLLGRLEREIAKKGSVGEQELSRWIVESVRIKSDIVSRDEREQDLRRILNFGHTFGHALENATGYARLLHGEAVALGMVVALQLSERCCGLDPRFSARVTPLLQSCFPRLRFPEVSWRNLERALGADKKTRAGRAVWVLLERPGRTVFHTPTGAAIRQSIEQAHQAWG
jgi:3-dehydroquinate synthase